MSLKWSGSPPRAEAERRQYEVRKNDAGKHELWRKIQFTRGAWSKWACGGEFKTEAEAQAYAEGF